MIFKELLQRYKEGIATEEERRIVEKELEKYRSIEEYLADDLFDEFFENNGMTEEVPMVNGDETENINKFVNRRLGKVVLTSVLIVVILYISIFYGVSGMVDWLYYDPTAVTQSEEQEYKRPDFYYDMQSYISLNMPGYSISSFTFQEPKGFGNYEGSYALKDLFTKNDQRYFINLSRGKLTHAIDGIFSTKNLFKIWEGFEKIQYHFSKENAEDGIILREVKRRNEETLRYLKELNPLSYISMSIVFDEDLTMEEFYHMSREHSSLNFKWVGIRTVEPGTRWSETQPMHLIGFNPNFNDEPSFTQRPDPQKYPLFHLNFREIRGDSILSKKDFPEAITEAYGIHFRSRLEYLRNREEFVKIFDYNYYKTDFYDDALKYIEEHGVNTYGVLVFGTAEEFLEYMDKIPYDSLYINEVLPIRPNIYYP